MATGAMMGLSVASGAMQYANAKQMASSLENQAKFNESVNNFNSAILETRKKEIMAQSDQATADRYRQVAQMLGSQKVAAAGGNISLSSDIVSQLEVQEREFADLDITAIRANARKEAMGIEVQQMDLQAQNKLASMQASQQGRNSVITGGAQFVGGLTQAYGFHSRAQSNALQARLTEAQIAKLNRS